MTTRRMLAVDHAALAGVAREQDELLAVAAPVHREHRAAGMDRLLLVQEVAVVVEQRDDAGVLPEVDAHQLQPGPVGQVLADAGGLGVADPHVLQDRAAAVEHQEPLVAAPGVDPRLGLGVAAEVAHGDAVGVVVELGVVAPELAPAVVPEGVADRQLVAPVAVEVEGIGVMPRLPLALPEPLQAAVEDPEVRVTVLDQDLAAARVARRG